MRNLERQAIASVSTGVVAVSVEIGESDELAGATDDRHPLVRFHRTRWSRAFQASCSKEQAVWFRRFVSEVCVQRFSQYDENLVVSVVGLIRVNGMDVFGLLLPRWSR